MKIMSFEILKLLVNLQLPVTIRGTIVAALQLSLELLALTLPFALALAFNLETLQLKFEDRLTYYTRYP